MHGIPLNSVSNSLSYDIVRFKIEVEVEEKFMCKNVAKQAQHVHCDISDNAPLCGGHMRDLDLTVNVLGLCDPSNLLFVLSAEERRALLKLLCGLVSGGKPIANIMCKKPRQRQRLLATTATTTTVLRLSRFCPGLRG